MEGILYGLFIGGTIAAVLFAIFLYWLKNEFINQRSHRNTYISSDYLPAETNQSTGVNRNSYTEPFGINYILNASSVLFIDERRSGRNSLQVDFLDLPPSYAESVNNSPVSSRRNSEVVDSDSDSNSNSDSDSNSNSDSNKQISNWNGEEGDDGLLPSYEQALVRIVISAPSESVNYSSAGDVRNSANDNR